VRTSRRVLRGVSLSSDVRALVDEAVDDIADGEWDRAAELLSESFAEQTICAQEQPAYELDSEIGGTRLARCHLHREA